MNLNIEGIGEVILAIILVILFIPITMILFPPSGSSYALDSMDIIFANTKLVDKSSDGTCRSSQIEITKGFNIDMSYYPDKQSNFISVNSEDKTHKKIKFSYNLKIENKYDSNNKLNTDGYFPINKDFSKDINENICICKVGSENILFPQPKRFGVIDSCESVFENE